MKACAKRIPPFAAAQCWSSNPVVLIAMHVICAKRIDGYQLRQAFLSGACAEPATANQKMTEDFSDLHGFSD